MRSRWSFLLLLAVSALGVEAPYELKTQFVPQISLMAPTDFSLTSSGVTVNYAGDNYGQPFLHFGWQRWLKNLGALNFYGLYRFGYTFSQGHHPVVLANSGAHDSDSVRLHWIPMSAGIMTEYSIAGAPFLRPYFTLSAGMHFLNQTTNFDGSQSFFLPFMGTGFGLSFINLDTGVADSLLGFSFGMSYQNTFVTSQPIRGWSFDFGINIRM